MKKRLGIIWMALCMAFVLAAVPDTVSAASGRVSISVSSGSINIGDTVTVTMRTSGPSGTEDVRANMTLTYDAKILQFVSCSINPYGGGGGSVTVTGVNMFTVTLKAIAAGNSSLSVSAIDGVNYDTLEELDSMTGSSTSVTVNNAASTGGGTGTGTGGGTGTAGGGTGTTGETGGTGGGTGTAGGTGGTGGGAGTTGGTALSADNSLKSLTISPGTLSPAFSGRTTSYTATVGNDVTSIAVSAVPANNKAVVESVTGNSSLQVGSNTIQIVVKAENGVTAAYTIHVTRQSAGTAQQPGSEAQETHPEDEQETINVGGMPYRISEKFKAEDIPVDFSEGTVFYHGEEYKGVSFDKGVLQLLWLVAEQGDGRFFIYDGVRDSVYPFVQLGSAERYVITLPAPVDAVMPEDYLQTSLVLEDGSIVTAYQRDAGGSELVSDFYRFYGVNYDGFEGWYQYDALEGTYQRINTSEEVVVVEEETFDASAELDALNEEYAELSERYSQEKAFARNMIALLVFAIAVLLVVIINLLIARFRRRTDELEEELPEEDSEEEAFAEEELLKHNVPGEDTYREGADFEEKEVFEEEPVFEKNAGEELPEKMGLEEAAGEFQKPEPESRQEKTVKNKKEGKELEVIDFNDL